MLLGERDQIGCRGEPESPVCFWGHLWGPLTGAAFFTIHHTFVSIRKFHKQTKTFILGNDRINTLTTAVALRVQRGLVELE